VRKAYRILVAELGKITHFENLGTDKMIFTLVIRN
jgi:hypothetical protein